MNLVELLIYAASIKLVERRASWLRPRTLQAAYDVMGEGFRLS